MMARMGFHIQAAKESINAAYEKNMSPLMHQYFTWTFLVLVAWKTGLIWVFLGWCILFKGIEHATKFGLFCILKRKYGNM